MGKLLRAISLVGRVVGLVLLIGVAWVVSSVQGIFGGEKVVNDSDSSDPLLGMNKAHADVSGGGWVDPDPGY